LKTGKDIRFPSADVRRMEGWSIPAAHPYPM